MQNITSAVRSQGAILPSLLERAESKGPGRAGAYRHSPPPQSRAEMNRSRRTNCQAGIAGKGAREQWPTVCAQRAVPGKEAPTRDR